MQFTRLYLLLSLLAAMLSAVPVFAADTSSIKKGAWAATVSVNRVSEVNSRIKDSIFDLGVTAVKYTKLIEMGSSGWSYAAIGNAPVADEWYKKSTVFTNLSTGQAPLGYMLKATDAKNELLPDAKYELPPDAKTNVATGSSPMSIRGAYFYKKFDVDKAAGLTSYKINVSFDDTIQIFINGNPVYTKSVNTSAQKNKYITAENVVIPATTFSAGENVIAVAVYGDYSDPKLKLYNGDLFFDLELIGMPPSKALILQRDTGWLYNDKAKNEPTGWKTAELSNSGDWLPGSAPFGFGRSAGQTVTTVGNADTIYYQKTVDLTKDNVASSYSTLDLRLLRDDGAVVYLNGTEIMRSNMPGKPGEAVPYKSEPIEVISSAAGEQYLTSSYSLKANLLNEGKNVFAVEIHQHASERETSATPDPQKQLTPTSAAFPLRLLLHVDASGKVKLLKEMTLMKDSANTKVILADSSLASGYQGVVVRDGVLVGLRTSAIGYDFPTFITNCDGKLENSGDVTTCTIVLGSNDATNPFLHRFHPDHDNLDDTFEKSATEAYEITRNITLTFDNRYPANKDEPERKGPSIPLGWGTELLGGTYSETIKGLYRKELSVAGWFTMKKIADVDQLICTNAAMCPTPASKP